MALTFFSLRHNSLTFQRQFGVVGRGVAKQRNSCPFFYFFFKAVFYDAIFYIHGEYILLIVLLPLSFVNCNVNCLGFFFGFFKATFYDDIFDNCVLY